MLFWISLHHVGSCMSTLYICCWQVTADIVKISLWRIVYLLNSENTIFTTLLVIYKNKKTLWVNKITFSNFHLKILKVRKKFTSIVPHTINWRNKNDRILFYLLLIRTSWNSFQMKPYAFFCHLIGNCKLNRMCQYWNHI